MKQRVSDLITKEKRAIFAERFLDRFLEPAFGTMTKTEIDVLVFSLLHDTRAFEGLPSQYEIARALRVTPARVRSLTMSMRLRDANQTEELLRSRIIEAISTSRFTKHGAVIEFGIEDPLLREDVAARLKKIGATTDSSFNREIIRIQRDAFVEFIADLMPEERKEAVRKALVKAGEPDGSLKGVLTGALRKLGAKIAGDAGEEIAKQVGPAIKDLLAAGANAVTSSWKPILQLESSKPSADEE